MPPRIELKNKLGTGLGTQVEVHVNDKYVDWMSYLSSGRNLAWCFPGKKATCSPEIQEAALVLARELYPLTDDRDGRSTPGGVMAFKVELRNKTRRSLDDEPQVQVFADDKYVGFLTYTRYRWEVTADFPKLPRDIYDRALTLADEQYPNG